jgi:DNA-binding PadR family transcriptional regulator
MLTTTELTVLGLLAFGERSGYDLARVAERSTGFMWAPSRSQIYKVLPRLVDGGYAKRHEVRQRRRPDKELYSITPLGRRALRAWIEEVDGDRTDAAPFVLKVFFGWLAPPDATLRQLDAYRSVLRARITEWEELRAGLAEDEPLHSRLALDHGLARARATLDWIGEAESAVTRGSGATSRRRRGTAAPRRA